MAERLLPSDPQADRVAGVARALPVAAPPRTAEPVAARSVAPPRSAGRAPLGLGWPPAAPEADAAPSTPDLGAEKITAGGATRAVHRIPASPDPAPGTAPTAADAPDPFDAGAVAVAAGIARRVDPTEVRFAAPGHTQAAPVARAATAVAERAPEEQPQPAQIVAAGPAAAPAQDLGALADELWERLEQRLRTDLMLERERRGTWPDA